MPMVGTELEKLFDRRSRLPSISDVIEARLLEEHKLSMDLDAGQAEFQASYLMQVLFDEIP